MKYMLLIYHEEQSWDGVTEAERQQIYAEYQTLIGELASRGQFVPDPSCSLFQLQQPCACVMARS